MSRIPVKVFGDYVVTFEAIPEDRSIERHFIRGCGWTDEQFAEIEDFEWFIACVSLFKDGELLSSYHLGGCCYEKEEDFYKEFAADYFADMARQCASEVPDSNLQRQVDEWRDALRTDSAKTKTV
jgi:hypothetical protein